MNYCEYLFNFCCCYNDSIQDGNYGNLRNRTSSDPVLIHEIYNTIRG